MRFFGHVELVEDGDDAEDAPGGAGAGELEGGSWGRI
jgi:hypothetical protein